MKGDFVVRPERPPVIDELRWDLRRRLVPDHALRRFQRNLSKKPLLPQQGIRDEYRDLSRTGERRGCVEIAQRAGSGSQGIRLLTFDPIAVVYLRRKSIAYTSKRLQSRRHSGSFRPRQPTTGMHSVPCSPPLATAAAAR
jgi:hypothetical protein